MSREVEQIKDRLDIVEVIGQYVPLQKAGANFKANCPFHNEKTPSFFVSPARGSYYCFGCGAKGDIFTFVEETEGLDFRGALEFLAQKAGVEITKVSPKVREENDRTLKAIQEAADYFRERLLKEKKTLDYLLKRGLSKEIIEKFYLGFAPAGWRNLKEFLTDKGFAENELLRAGLIKKGDEAKESYDVFRERIIFPLAESSGRIVGFSGRATDEQDNPPKYLNSPDSVFFRKGELLYGLDKAKRAIRDKNFAIIVEGQMDLLMSHQAGITNSVAASGTAVTPAHLERLKKISQRLLISLDADGAGLKAALKTATLALERGMEVKIAKLTGKDPAEIIGRNVEEYKECLRGALPFIEFVLGNILDESKDERTRTKRVEREIVPLLSLLPSAVERAHTIKVIANKTKIPERALEEDTERFKRTRGKVYTFRTAEEIKEEKDHSQILNQIERHAAGLLFAEEGGTEFPLKISEALSFLNQTEKEIILKRYRPDRENLVFEVENYYGSDEKGAARRALEEVILNFKRDSLKKRLVDETRALGRAEEKKDKKRAREILKEIQKVSEDINKLTDTNG